jgi:hypothetical protein
MMNDAALRGQFDPYTGEELAWEKIDTWNIPLQKVWTVARSFPGALTIALSR